MTEELKPCPFCGGNAYHLSCYNGTDFWWEIACCHCGAMVASRKTVFPRNEEARDDAIKKWNRRVTQNEADN